MCWRIPLSLPDGSAPQPHGSKPQPQNPHSWPSQFCLPLSVWISCVHKATQETQASSLPVVILAIIRCPCPLSYARLCCRWTQQLNSHESAKRYRSLQSHSYFFAIGSNIVYSASQYSLCYVPKTTTEVVSGGGVGWLEQEWCTPFINSHVKSNLWKQSKAVWECDWSTQKEVSVIGHRNREVFNKHS